VRTTAFETDSDNENLVELDECIKKKRSVFASNRCMAFLKTTKRKIRYMVKNGFYYIARKLERLWPKFGFSIDMEEMSCSNEYEDLIEELSKDHEITAWEFVYVIIPNYDDNGNFVDFQKILDYLADE
jgi:hypothetical protein